MRSQNSPATFAKYTMLISNPPSVLSLLFPRRVPWTVTLSPADAPIPCHSAIHTSGSRFDVFSLLFLSLHSLYPRLTVCSFIKIISSKTKSFLLTVINKGHLYLYCNGYWVAILAEVFGGAMSVQCSDLKLCI